ncbi:AAC(3) family N-acetyltransferase [Pseudooceanicola sp. CBS1P-1]|uniref:Aminoglycoside N(3)-acetyltransferase n=1 Tax=Pseudooceanicola albus TaxID=2692189 RepID=A0A6L7GCD5_9RHOB|nr:MULTISPECIES: AAC(3) family N-acetyltransferase [Pseudooceanicola]MBT9387052.1 AAC(3) family N-acetyltransferase [Pseudooceanicola endophyticus]MXN21218.1 aminoglycoside N(3)-acetyltransferase [Pseudooceanicola albus]
MPKLKVGNGPALPGSPTHLGDRHAAPPQVHIEPTLTNVASAEIVIVRRMVAAIHTQTSLFNDLISLGVYAGDGLFVHGSMSAVGATVGGARTIVESLLKAVGGTGLVGMPDFSSDACFPAEVDLSRLTQDQIAEIEDAVPGFDVAKSTTSGMGVIAETFRTWPGTQRSDHPAVSICLNGEKANDFLKEHSLAWATGEKTPLGKLRDRKAMRILLIGVGWNRCSALHTAETFAQHKRTKTRRFKNGGPNGSWIETPDVTDDTNRLFPKIGEAFEKTGAVSFGKFGGAECKLCDFRSLVDFATGWIDCSNKRSGDLS